MHKGLRIPNIRYIIIFLFDILDIEIKNWEPSYRRTMCVKKLSCCNKRPQTSSLQTFGLLTVLTLIGYGEYTAGTCLSETCQNLNTDELKRLLIEVWFGIQRSVTDHTIDQWRVFLNWYNKAS